MGWMSRRSPSLIAGLPVILAMAVLAAACSSTPEAATVPSRSTAPATGASPGSAVPATLDFTAPRLGGGTLNGADYAGHDTAIWFWAPW